MFTGLIADLGSVRSIARDSDGATLQIVTRLAAELAEGDSVAVNGVCLTASRVSGDGFEAEAMNETLARSSLGKLQSGAAVNLELPLRASRSRSSRACGATWSSRGRWRSTESA